MEAQAHEYGASPSLPDNDEPSVAVGSNMDIDETPCDALGAEEDGNPSAHRTLGPRAIVEKEKDESDPIAGDGVAETDALSGPTVRLETKDGRVFEVCRRVAEMSATIKHMLDDLVETDNDNPIPLPNVDGDTMAKVVCYCEYHVTHPDRSSDDTDVIPADKQGCDACVENEMKKNRKKKKNQKRNGSGNSLLDEISPWDREFCDVPQSELFSIILAANYLDIKPLLEMTCKMVASMMVGLTPEEIREKFGIENDLTPEEEEEIRRENEWNVDI